MILATAEGFGVDDDLMFTIGQSLAVVALDNAMGCPQGFSNFSSKGGPL